LRVFWLDGWSPGAVEGLVGDIVGALGAGVVLPLD
jgi:hypothetical protein